MRYKFLMSSVAIGSGLLLCMVFASCKKFIEVSSPVTSINSGNVYTSDNTAISVLTAIYAEMANGGGTSGITSLSLFPELSADILTLNGIVTDNAVLAYYQNNLSSTVQTATPAYWGEFYSFIYQTNAAIEGLNSSTSLNPLVKSQLIGEAHFMRAFFYFYLVNLYGDVPLVLSTDYKTNSVLPKTSKDLIYQQVINDLKLAQSSLGTDYVNSTLLEKSAERIRPNKIAATALLARVYLFMEDFTNAEIQSSSVLDNKSKYDLVTLDDVFKKNSKETIWSLQPVISNQNTWESRLFILPPTGPGPDFPFSLSDHLITSFEIGDRRLATWTGSVLSNSKRYYYPAKYKAGTSTTVVSEYSMVLRASEQYLIRAEARAQLGRLIGTSSASSDLNEVRNRAGLPISAAITKQEMLDAILHERQTELFTEWGHRWFDLKRTGKINGIMDLVCPTKGVGVIWKPYKSLYPIPQVEIDRNPGMTGQQNQGY